MESLEPEQLFSAMPPLEALKLLCSLKVSMKTSRKGNPLKLAHFDISRAHFMPKARRELYVELPDEDPMKQKGFVGLLLRSMYGTQDASNLWQEDYTETLAQRGYTPGRSNPAMFHSHQGDGRMLVHGDDFVLLADDGEIKAVEQLLKSKYTVKVVAVIGDGSSQQEAVILNRIVRNVPPNSTNRMAMEIETDQRHVDILLREHGLDDSRSKGVDTPRVKKSESQVFAGLESLPLDREGVRLYRSGTMRISYLGQDRADVQEAAKCLSRRMQSPTQADLVELKRAVRYLLKFPRAVLVFEEQELPRELNGWVDADFAGELVSRRSSSGLVLLFGKHCLKTSSSVQEPIGLSSGVSEFYACVKGGAALLGMRSLMMDWGVCPKLTLKIRTDSSAAKGFATRRGLGRQRHVSSRFLWLQDKVSKGELKVVKVGTTDQLADFLTKPVTARWLAEKSPELGLEFRGGRSPLQRRLVS